MLESVKHLVKLVHFLGMLFIRFRYYFLVVIVDFELHFIVQKMMNMLVVPIKTLVAVIASHWILEGDFDQLIIAFILEMAKLLFLLINNHLFQFVACQKGVDSF